VLQANARLSTPAVGYSNTPNSVIAGLADAAVIRSRSRCAVTGRSSRISRRAPTLGAIPSSSQSPAFHRSTAIPSTRCPNRIASRTRITRNFAGRGNSNVASAFSTPSSVAQYVSLRPSARFAAAYCGSSRLRASVTNCAALRSEYRFQRQSRRSGNSERRSRSQKTAVGASDKQGGAPRIREHCDSRTLGM
jgi:hypothetical protein